MKKYLLILRGCSGSGKSTYAKRLQKTYHKVLEFPDLWLKTSIVSADDYFIRPDGLYDWSPRLLKNAHQWCKDRVKKHMCGGFHLIVLDNTNTMKWEYQPYLELAELYGYEIRERIIGVFDAASVQLYAQRNVHKVPIESIQKMANRFER